MARIQHHRDWGNYLEIHSGDSITEITDTMLQHCDDTMGANSPDIIVEYPVYLRDIYSTKEPRKLTKIGYVSLIFEDAADGYVVHHYTLDKKELPNEWNAVSFYGGEYGLKQAQ